MNVEAQRIAQHPKQRASLDSVPGVKWGATRAVVVTPLFVWMGQMVPSAPAAMTMQIVPTRVQGSALQVDASPVI